MPTMMLLRVGLYTSLLLVWMPQSYARTTAEVARQFLQVLLVEADLPRAYRDYAVPNFIEHNPDIGNGYAAKMAYFAARQANNPSFPLPAQWANIIDHVIVDADLFAVHRHVFTQSGDRGRVFVDIWRIANDKIVEHWDVIQPVPEFALNANPMWCGQGSDYVAARALGNTLAKPTCGAPELAANRADSLAVVQSYAAMLRRGDAVDAVSRFIAPNYIQHSPHIENNLAKLAAYLSGQFSSSNQKRSVAVVDHVLAQGNLVLIHRHVTRPTDPRGTVGLDIFRVENGLIVEHWDVKQPVPTTSVNGNTMW
jgi:predicted SnoaL-like aldol condensation-catalyzing enzyme